MSPEVRLSEMKYHPQNRAERLIALGRTVLSGFFLLAIWLDPSEPSRYALLTYVILACYLGYSLLLLAAVWKLRFTRIFSQILIHAIDLVVFAVVIFLTEGPTSPFFVYFVFLLVCATLRWQWRGALWSAVAALTIVVGLAWYPSGLFQHPNFELNRFIIRIVYLAVVAVLLGYLGAYEERLRRELSRLAEWPRSLSAELRDMVGETLKHAAGICGAPRMLLIWEEEEEPWVHMASFSGGELQYQRESPGSMDSLVAKPLEGSGFFCQETRALQPSVVQKTATGLNVWQGPPLDQNIQQRFSISSVVALPLRGETLTGYLFMLDKPGLTSDDLVVGEIVARELLARIEHFFLLRQLKMTAVADERLHLARDLHDGVLQSLTGAALQLETVHRLVESDPETARLRLKEIQQLIATEQRELRSHISELKPSLPGRTPEDYELKTRLEGLVERIRKHWNLPTDVIVRPETPRISRSMAREIYYVVHESLINAARHAAASALTADLAFETDRVHITITDNGHGFPFHGQYDHDTLFDMMRGPVTLKERIAALRGTLSIDSRETGARLDITLPLAGNGD